jgi:hypothetical protein
MANVVPQAPPPEPSPSPAASNRGALYGKSAEKIEKVRLRGSSLSSGKVGLHGWRAGEICRINAQELLRFVAFACPETPQIQFRTLTC